jgi:hypothetical protein
MEPLDTWEEWCENCPDIENPCVHTTEKLYGGGEQ